MKRPEIQLPWNDELSKLAETAAVALGHEPAPVAVGVYEEPPGHARKGFFLVVDFGPDRRSVFLAAEEPDARKLLGLPGTLRTMLKLPAPAPATTLTTDRGSKPDDN